MKYLIDVLPIEPSHIYALERLPLHHKDPFDRLLIAQSIIIEFPFLSKDTEFENYPITCVW